MSSDYHQLPSADKPTKFSINLHNPHGEFYLDFKKDPKVSFYGQKISELERFRRYGNLPHNGVAVNKIINHLGRHLLSMEEKDKKITNEHKKQFHQIEKTANALYIDLFCALAPLEQARFPQRPNITELESQILTLFEHYTKGLQELPELREKLTSQQNSLVQKLKELRVENKPLTSLELRLFYQELLNDYRDLQQDISFLQRPFLGITEMANSSLTEAFNDATYELEAHKFGNDKPTTDQLWMTEDGFLSTEEMPNLRKDLALKTSCIDSEGQYDPEEYQKRKEDIETQNLEVKNKTASISDAIIRQGANTISEIDSFYKSVEELPQSKHLREQPLIYFEESDLFSSIGAASYQVGKYFEREIGAKHPMVSLAFFLGASVTFTAAGLASVGVAPSLMSKILVGASKVLTIGGKIGSPDQVAQAIRQISDGWLSLCHTDGKLFQTLVMNGLGLPKITFVAADALFNDLEDKDSITSLAKKWCEENLEGKTTPEQIEETAKNIVLTSIILGVAIGAGLGAEQLIHAKAGMGQAIGSILNKISDVHSTVFSDLVKGGTPAEQIKAYVSLILTVKTAGLLVGKVGLLFLNMREPAACSAEEKQAFDQQKDAVHMLEVLLCMQSSNTDTFSKWYKMNKIDIKVIDNFYQACIKYPEIKEKFEKHPEFLQQLGINIPTKSATMTFLEWLGAGLVFTFSLGISALYESLTTGFSAEEEKQLAKQAQEDNFDGKFLNLSKFFSDKFFAPVVGVFGLILAALEAPFRKLLGGTPFFTQTKAFADGLKLLAGMGRLLIFILTPIKMLAMGLFELVKRTCMIVLNAWEKLKLIGNALLNGEYQKTLIGFGGLVIDFIIMPIAYLWDLLASTVVAGGKSLWNLLISPFIGLAALASPLFTDSSIKDNFNNWFDEWSFHPTGFGNARRAYLDQYSAFLKAKDTSADIEIDLIAAPGGQDIQKERQSRLSSIHDFFASIADWCTEKAIYVRSATLRTVEETAQTKDYERLGHDADTKSSHNAGGSEQNLLQELGHEHRIGMDTANSAKAEPPQTSSQPTSPVGTSVIPDEHEGPSIKKT